MINLKEVVELDEKLKFVEQFVTDLPEWFGENTTIHDVIESVGSFESTPFFVAVDESEIVGFICLKIHNACTAEIAMMAVLGSQHGKGIGKKLVIRCEEFCRDNKMEFLTVKTIDESGENDNYGSTRAFYSALGFKPLQVFPKFWGEGQHCLFSVKCISY